MRALCLALIAASCLVAQQASLTGLVTDPSGTAIPNANVSLRNIETGIEATSHTGPEGYYSFPTVPPGKYTLTAANTGFKSVVRAGIRLDVDQKATVNLQMALGQVTERITVEGQAPLVASEDAAVGTVVDREKLEELPLNGRNPLDLVTLAPGVTPNDRGPAAANVNGGRDNTSDILIDGSNSTSTDQGDALTTPLLEGVAEFKVETAAFSAEFGRAGGAVKVVTRSGTNAWHGSAFEFLRNDAFDATDFFSNLAGQGKARNRYDQFGASIGGVVRIPKIYNGRNRTFFFFTPGYLRQSGRGLLLTTIPGALERNGDFSHSSASSGPVAIYDPATTVSTAAGKYTRDPFPGSIIPTSRFNPIGVNILNAGYPLPNASLLGSNYVSAGPSSNNTNGYTVKIDHNFSNRHQISSRYLRGTAATSNPQPWPGHPAQSVSTASGDLFTGNLSQNVALRDTLIFSPTLLNEFVYGLQYFHNMLKPASANQNWDAKLGIQNGAPYVFPTVTVSGYTALQSGNISDEHDVNHQFTDSVTWITGLHTIKAGFEFRSLYYAWQQPAGTGGSFTFDTQPTRSQNESGANTGGQAVASLLLGVPSSSSLTVNNQKFGYTWQYYGVFVQDKWKASRKLTIDYGLRWEYTRPGRERWNRMSVFDLATQQLDFAGENGFRTTLFNGTLDCFAPRLGLAYAPSADGKTSIRASFGIFYLPVNNFGAPGYNTGFTATQTFQTLDGGITFPSTLSQLFPVVTLSRAANPGSAVSTIGPEYKVGSSNQWTLSIQREILPRTLVDVSYIGMKGTHLMLQSLNINQVPAELLGPGNAQTRRPYPNWGNITSGFPPRGDSIYHSAQFKVERRLAGGLILLGSYSVQKSIDDGSGIVAFRTVGNLSIQDIYNLHAERSISSFDRTQNVVLTGIYDLPFGKGQRFLHSGGLASAVLGGWKLSGIFRARSGIPLVMASAQNLTGALGTGYSRPNRLRSGKLPDGTQSIYRWFDLSAFAQPAQYVFGNDSRTEPDLRGPGNATMDMSFGRVIRLTEKARLQIRAEAFNALNRVNFSNPNTTIGNINAGIITSCGAARIVQLGSRIWF
jgi:hypothetical protein